MEFTSTILSGSRLSLRGKADGDISTSYFGQ